MAGSDHPYSFISEYLADLCSNIKNEIPQNDNLYEYCSRLTELTDRNLVVLVNNIDDKKRQIDLLKYQIDTSEIIREMQAKVITDCSNHIKEQSELLDKQQDLLNKYSTSCIIS